MSIMAVCFSTFLPSFTLECRAGTKMEACNLCMAKGKTKADSVAPKSIDKTTCEKETLKVKLHDEIPVYLENFEGLYLCKEHMNLRNYNFFFISNARRLHARRFHAILMCATTQLQSVQWYKANPP